MSTPPTTANLKRHESCRASAAAEDVDEDEVFEVKLPTERSVNNLSHPPPISTATAAIVPVATAAPPAPHSSLDESSPSYTIHALDATAGRRYVVVVPASSLHKLTIKRLRRAIVRQSAADAEADPALSETGTLESILDPSSPFLSREASGSLLVPTAVGATAIPSHADGDRITFDDVPSSQQQQQALPLLSKNNCLLVWGPQPLDDDSATVADLLAAPSKGSNDGNGVSCGAFAEEGPLVLNIVRRTQARRTRPPAPQQQRDQEQEQPSSSSPPPPSRYPSVISPHYPAADSLTHTGVRFSSEPALASLSASGGVATPPRGAHSSTRAPSLKGGASHGSSARGSDNGGAARAAATASETVTGPLLSAPSRSQSWTSPSSPHGDPNGTETPEKPQEKGAEAAGVMKEENGSGGGGGMDRGSGPAADTHAAMAFAPARKGPSPPPLSADPPRTSSSTTGPKEASADRGARPKTPLANPTTATVTTSARRCPLVVRHGPPSKGADTSKATTTSSRTSHSLTPGKLPRQPAVTPGGANSSAGEQSRRPSLAPHMRNTSHAAADSSDDEKNKRRRQQDQENEERRTNNAQHARRAASPPAMKPFTTLTATTAGISPRPHPSTQGESQKGDGTMRDRRNVSSPDRFDYPDTAAVAAAAEGQRTSPRRRRSSHRGGNEDEQEHREAGTPPAAADVAAASGTEAHGDSNASAISARHPCAREPETVTGECDEEDQRNAASDANGTTAFDSALFLRQYREFQELEEILRMGAAFLQDEEDGEEEINDCHQNRGCDAERNNLKGAISGALDRKCHEDLRDRAVHTTHTENDATSVPGAVATVATQTSPRLPLSSSCADGNSTSSTSMQTSSTIDRLTAEERARAQSRIRALQFELEKVRAEQERNTTWVKSLQDALEASEADRAALRKTQETHEEQLRAYTTWLCRSDTPPCVKAEDEEGQAGALPSPLSPGEARQLLRELGTLHYSQRLRELALASQRRCLALASETQAALAAWTSAVTGPFRVVVRVRPPVVSLAVHKLRDVMVAAEQEECRRLLNDAVCHGGSGGVGERAEGLTRRSANTLSEAKTSTAAPTRGKQQSEAAAVPRPAFLAAPVHKINTGSSGGSNAANPIAEIGPVAAAAVTVLTADQAAGTVVSVALESLLAAPTSVSGGAPTLVTGAAECCRGLVGDGPRNRQQQRGAVHVFYKVFAEELVSAEAVLRRFTDTTAAERKGGYHDSDSEMSLNRSSSSNEDETRKPFGGADSEVESALASLLVDWQLSGGGSYDKTPSCTPETAAATATCANTNAQLHLYNSEVRPLVMHALAGADATVLAYGQADSGKTYTIFGPSRSLRESRAAASPSPPPSTKSTNRRDCSAKHAKDTAAPAPLGMQKADGTFSDSSTAGIAPRALEQIFASLAESATVEELTFQALATEADRRRALRTTSKGMGPFYEVQLSLLELYQDHVVDLLAEPEQVPIDREFTVGGCGNGMDGNRRSGSNKLSGATTALAGTASATAAPGPATGTGYTLVSPQCTVRVRADGTAEVMGLTHLRVPTAAAAMAALEAGLSRRYGDGSSSSSIRGQAGEDVPCGRSHVVLTIHISRTVSVPSNSLIQKKKDCSSTGTKKAESENQKAKDSNGAQGAEEASTGKPQRSKKSAKTSGGGGATAAATAAVPSSQEDNCNQVNADNGSESNASDSREASGGEEDFADSLTAEREQNPHGGGAAKSNSDDNTTESESSTGSAHRGGTAAALPTAAFDRISRAIAQERRAHRETEENGEEEEKKKGEKPTTANLFSLSLQTVTSRLTLVDLASFERVSETGVSGDRLREAQHANKGLSALGDVMAALAANHQHHTHHPSATSGGDAKPRKRSAPAPSKPARRGGKPDRSAGADESSSQAVSGSRLSAGGPSFISFRSHRLTCVLRAALTPSASAASSKNRPFGSPREKKKGYSSSALFTANAATSAARAVGSRVLFIACVAPMDGPMLCAVDTGPAAGLLDRYFQAARQRITARQHQLQLASVVHNARKGPAKAKQAAAMDKSVMQRVAVAASAEALAAGERLLQRWKRYAFILQEQQQRQQQQCGSDVGRGFRTSKRPTAGDGRPLRAASPSRARLEESHEEDGKDIHRRVFLAERGALSTLQFASRVQL